MKFSIRQLLTVTVALAIFVATFSALFKLKETRVQISREQQRLAENQVLTKRKEAELRDIDGIILQRTIERDILKRIADPEKNQHQLDSIRSRIVNQFNPPNDQVTLIQLPSLNGWSYLISVPEDWNVRLNFGTNEKPTGTSQYKKVKAPYDQFFSQSLAAGIHSLDVSLGDRENSDAHDLEVYLDRTKIFDFVWIFTSKGASSVSSSRSNDHVTIDRQLLEYGQPFIECNGQKDGDNSGSWKIWLDEGTVDSSAVQNQ